MARQILVFLITLCSSFYVIAESKDISHLSIAELQQKMLKGELSSEQLVKHYLTRIAQYDKAGPKINAISQLNQHAYAQAQVLDQQIKIDGLTGLLHGIPVLVKDNIDVKGMVNSAGSLALANHIPNKDAFLINQLKQAGAVVIGKSNLSEWANFRSTASSSGWSSLYGQTRNPYDPSRSPCGSSSGSGAGIAAGFATVAIGTETDGSVVCPAAINGIVGIKPTLGTVSRQGIIPISHSQDTAGTMATTVTDAVILLAAIAQYDYQDKQATESKIDYLSHLIPEGLQGKRIGVLRNLTGYHAGVDRVFEQAIADLKDQGAAIIDNLNMEDNKVGDNEFTVLLYEFKHDIEQYLKTTGENLPKSLTELIAYNDANADKAMPYFAQEIFLMAEEKGKLTDKAYLEARKYSLQASGKNGIDKLLKEHKLDLLIAPTTGPAWKIDLVTGDHFLGAASSAAAIAGYPHITVPMGYVHKLPLGLSFIGGKLSEGTLVEAAFAYEQATKHRIAPAME